MPFSSGPESSGAPPFPGQPSRGWWVQCMGRGGGWYGLRPRFTMKTTHGGVICGTCRGTFSKSSPCLGPGFPVYRMKGGVHGMHQTLGDPSFVLGPLRAR